MKKCLKTKKLLSVLLSLALLCGILPLSVFSVSAEGTTVKISSYEELEQLATDVNGGTDNYSGKTVKLADDFPSGGTATALTTPIGKNGNEFQGNFDGNNKEVKLDIKNSAGSNNTDRAGELGMFGFIRPTKSGQVIKNIIITGTVSDTISGNGAVASLIGKVDGETGNKLTIENCVNKSAITSPDGYSAGLVGVLAQAEVTFTDCENYGTVTGGSAIGGFIGQVECNAKAILSSCNNYGDIGSTLQDNSVGGFIGSSADNTSIEMKNCQNTGTISAHNTIGGFIGISRVKVTMSKCKNQGTISGSEVAGGIIGKIETNSAQLSNCSNEGNVTVLYGDDVGGLVGASYGTVNIDTSTNKGNVTALAGKKAGGLVGYAKSNLEIKDSENTGTIYGKYHIGGIYGRTTKKVTIDNETKNTGKVENSLVSTGYLTSDVCYKVSDSGLSAYKVFDGDSCDIMGKVGGVWKQVNDSANSMRFGVFNAETNERIKETDLISANMGTPKFVNNGQVVKFSYTVTNNNDKEVKVKPNFYSNTCVNSCDENENEIVEVDTQSGQLMKMTYLDTTFFAYGNTNTDFKTTIAEYTDLSAFSDPSDIETNLNAEDGGFVVFYGGENGDTIAANTSKTYNFYFGVAEPDQVDNITKIRQYNSISIDLKIEAPQVGKALASQATINSFTSEPQNTLNVETVDICWNDGKNDNVKTAQYCNKYTANISGIDLSGLNNCEVTKDTVITATLNGKPIELKKDSNGYYSLSYTFTDVQHDWDDGKVVKNATKKHGAVRLFTCKACHQATRTEYLPQSTQTIKLLKKNYTAKTNTVKIKAKAKGSKLRFRALNKSKYYKLNKYGKITFRNGAKGTYKIKVRIRALVNNSYKQAKVTKVIKVTLK